MPCTVNTEFDVTISFSEPDVTISFSEPDLAISFVESSLSLLSFFDVTDVILDEGGAPILDENDCLILEN